MGSVYAIANQKGGVGKTTTAVNVAACAAAEGAQVLLCDLDAQCNATVALGLGREVRPSSYDCLIGACSVAEAAQPAGPDNLWIVPASGDLAGAAVELPRIEVAEQHLGARGRGARGDVDGGRRLAHPTLLIGDRVDRTHSTRPYPRGEMAPGGRFFAIPGRLGRPSGVGPILRGA